MSNTHDEWEPSSGKPPPSSFAFPFQAYPGNPDPGLGIPGVSRRRSSLDSATPRPAVPVQSADEIEVLSHSGSFSDLRKPFAPFMAGGDASSSTGSLPRSSSSNSLYRQSAAANMMPAAPAAVADPTTPTTPIPRVSSTHSFRAPFLAPSSRPNSSFWAPPSYAVAPVASPTASTTALPLTPFKAKPPAPSTRLAAPLEKADKPWLQKREKGSRSSYILTLSCIFLGLCGAGALIYFGYSGVHLLDESKLCSVLDEQFNGPDLDGNTWTPTVELGGFGNGEFQMTTAESENLRIQDGQLYITPTLTSDEIGRDAVLDNGKYTLKGCTTNNKTACTAASSNARGTVINPVKSARIDTKSKATIRFGKVEIRAKMPLGDWLWPAIWMLPQDDSVYGPWPVGGEIDIVEARGNGLSYPNQGANFVRASLNYGPFSTAFNTIFGWWSNKRTTYAAGWHTYVLEWDESFMRVYVDKRTQSLLEVTLGKGKHKSFWDKAGFPSVAQNGSAQAVVTNPYTAAGSYSNSAPFDQNFYLVVNLAVGGTSGWFPDGKGGKMWYDGSLSAMRDFARAQDDWERTWPDSVDDRSLRM